VGWRARWAPASPTRSIPRAWQTFEPRVLGVSMVGEPLSPVIDRDLEASALPVAARRGGMKTLGPEPIWNVGSC